MCPNINNEQIRNEFNEIVTALGGNPLTIEEFRNKELRLQRTGTDAAAMDAAYDIWDQNQGNPIDKAPNGSESILFKSLMNHYGDRQKAIRAKANTYSDAFKNWFGDWTSEDITNVSKVVDENGEPLIVWHHTDDPNLVEFSIEFDNYFAKSGGTKKAIFFDENTTGTLNRKYDLPGFLNIRQLTTYKGTKEDLHKKGTTYRQVVNESAEANPVDGGLHMAEFDDNRMENQSVWIIHNPNQSKSIDNNGNFSTVDDNRYHNLTPLTIQQKLQNDGILHKYYNNWFITKSKYETAEQYDSLLERIEKEAILNNYTVDFIKRPLSTQVIFTSTANEDILPRSEENKNVLKVFEFLQERFPGLMFGGTVSKKEAKPGQNAFIKDGKVYFVEGRITDEITIEECLHPFVNALYTENRDLFEQLFKEAEKNYQTLWQELKSTYTSDKVNYSVRQELVAQVLAREFNKEHKENKPSKFRELVNGFLEWLKGLIQNFINPFSRDLNLIEVSKLPKMSIQDIVKLINTSDTQFVGITYSGTFNSISSSKIEEANKQIKTGIRQRLNAISRYQTRNIKVIQETQRLIDQLNRLDAIEGTVEFVNYVSDNIIDAFEFLNKSFDEITSTQIVQLKRDYLGFFIPMIRNIQKVLDTTTELEGIEDYDNFRDTVDRIVNAQSTIINRYDNILEEKTRNFLEEYATTAGSATVEEMMEWLRDPNKDLGWMEMWLGQNSSAGNEVIRIMADILNQQINTTKRNTFNHGVSLVNLLKKAKEANKGIDVMSLLQEKDKNGQTTGYFVRDLNYGQFYQDLQKEYDRIISEMGIEKDAEGNLVFADREQERQFRKRKIKAQLKLGNLKYTKEYYEERAKLPIEAQDALDYINSELDFFMSNLKDGEVIRWDKLTAEKKARLDDLYRQKAELYSEYYADGEAKSGIDLTIARALMNMRKNMRGKLEYKINYEKFNNSAAAMIDRYGADSEIYKKWYYNSTQEIYSDEFYEKLESISAPKSEELQALYEERSTLLNMYRDQDSRAIEQVIPDAIKEKIIELDKLIAEGKTRRVLEEEDLKFEDIAEMRKTEQYYEDQRAAIEEGRHTEWYHKNHYEVNGKLRVASYYTYMVPISKKYIVRKPNKFYSQLDTSSSWVNSEYNPEGEYVQPKRSLYDNRVAYNKVISNPTIKALYDSLIETMQNSNRKIAFAQNQNPYRLPQISGRMMATIARSDDKWKALKYVVADQFRIKDDDTEYVNDYEYRPDGSEIKLIPTRFMKMLDDPKMITSDVVGSVIQYFEMAENYKNMSSVQNDLEMVLYELEQLQVKSGKKVRTGKESRIYQKAATLLDMSLYGKKKEQIKVKGYNISKGLNKIYNYISLSNLSQNVWAMTANYVTGQGNLDIESIAGKYFDISDITFAKKEFLKRFGHLTMNIGNVNDKDKLVMMMQMNQVTRSNQETFDRLDQSSTLRAINQHFWYNGYTAGDFTIKSQLLLAVYHGYKYVDGEYLTKEQFIAKYYAEDRKLGAKKFKQLKETLWDAYDVIDGELKVVKNKEAVNKIQGKVTTKINTLATRIDGNITDVDRAQIHQNAITQFFAMHRNFLISGIQERLKAKQFNYSTGQMEGGMYSDALKFFKGRFSKDKINVIASIISDYNNLDELEKYNVRRVYMDLMNIMVWSMIISTLFVAAADDDPDDYMLQALAYATTRISFEFRTLYNPVEVTNLFNSPSAAVSSLENAFNYIKLAFPGTYFYENNMFSSVKSGAYKGWPKILRNTVKLTPLKNIIEAMDTKGIRSKRNYLEHQMMF